MHLPNTASSSARTDIVMKLYLLTNTAVVVYVVVNQVLAEGWTWITTIAVCGYAACFVFAAIELWRPGWILNG